MSKQESNKRVTFNHILVLLLLCFSGNPLFVSHGNYQQNFVFCLILFFSVCVARNQSKVIIKAISFAAPFVLLSILHLFEFDNVITPVAFFCVSLLIGCIAIGTIAYLFEKTYVDVMFCLAVVSLLFFGVFKYTGWTFGIPLSNTDGVSLVFYTQLLSYGEFYDRNSGMFWEPGAYQGYLNLALFFLLKSDSVGKEKRIKFIIFTIAILTTSSTTGYLVYATLIIFYVIHSSQLTIGKKILLLFAVVAFFSYEFYELEFLKDKLEYETSLVEKDKSRVLDYIYFGKVFKDNPLFGVGLVDMPSGNGFLSFLLSWGMFGTFYFFVVLYSRVKKYWGGRDALIFLLILILCLQGEGFLSYPLFLGLPLLSLTETKSGFSL